MGYVYNGYNVIPGTRLNRNDGEMEKRLEPEVVEIMKSLPEGRSLVRHVYSGPRLVVYAEYYSVPAGTVVDGEKVMSGEFVAAHDSYRYNWIAPAWYVEDSHFVLGRPANWTTYPQPQR